MSNRVAFVTGGAQGIGKGISETLGAQGFRVAVADLNIEAAEATAAEINAAGGEAIAVRVDVTDTASVQSAVKEVSAQLGPIEIAVNNAGWDDFMKFLDTTEEFWDRVLEINFKGALRVTQAVVPGMIERGFGRVVNVGSDAAASALHSRRSTQARRVASSPSRRPSLVRLQPRVSPPTRCAPVRPTPRLCASSPPTPETTRTRFSPA